MNSSVRILLLSLSVAPLVAGPPALAAGAPAWLHALAGTSLPAYGEKTNAVLLYSGTAIEVEANGKLKRLERRAYRILRPDGAARGRLGFVIDGKTRVVDLHAWCIPAAGKDYELSRRDAVEAGLSDVENGMLATDIRGLYLRIPAAAPGNTIGYEITEEQTPYFMADAWRFQDVIPVREAQYSLQLPVGWTFRSVWRNHPETAATQAGPNQWQWTLNDVDPLLVEPRMPFAGGLAGGMIVTLMQPGGPGQGIKSWSDVGVWYAGLARGRRDLSPELRQKALELTAAAPSPLAKMQALAIFVQNEVRYVAIELGIGGYQPHSASEVFAHRFGDCKDKATLLSAMLEAIGVKSYYVLINTARGAVTAESPPAPYFNHAILAVALPADMDDPSLEATIQHATLGNLLFFDPTDPLTPFGSLSGALQRNDGLLVAPDGGELMELPQLPANSNGIARTAKLTLDEQGSLRGEVREVRVGRRAAEQRWALRTAKADTDQIRPVERLLAASFPAFQITEAAVSNLRAPERPFEWRYSIEADHYAKGAGDLLLVRPRVIGVKALGFLETKEPRTHAIEFDAAEHDTDVFEIALPAGYKVDEIPAPVDIDDGFASYHSKTEAVGRTLRYTRTYEISTLTVPADKADVLKTLYRAIEADERSAAVLTRLSR
jgi:hypothetical protein